MSESRGAFHRIRRVLTRRAGLFATAMMSNLRLTHGLDPAWRSRYAQLRREFRKQDPAFFPSRMWSSISLLYRLLLRGRGLSQFKSTLGRFLTVYEPDHPQLLEAVYHLYWTALKERDTWGLLARLEEPPLGEGTQIVYRGRRLSIDLLQSIEEFYAIAEARRFEQDDPVVFCEVGAGYGRLAHVVLSAMPRATYLIFDLPESLLLSQYYLTTLEPAWKAALYPESVQALRRGEPLSTYRLLFGLPQLLRSVPPGAIDVFINIYSFMEMTPEQVARYFQIIEDLQVGVLYLKQHKHELNPLDRVVIGEASYPVRPSWSRLYHRTSILYEHVFEAAYRVNALPEKGELLQMERAGQRAAT